MLARTLRNSVEVGDLIAWMQTLALHTHEARRWEPKRLRHRVFTLPAHLARTGRRVWLHLAHKGPWADLVALGVHQLRQLRQLGGARAVPG